MLHLAKDFFKVQSIESNSLDVSKSVPSNIFVLAINLHASRVRVCPNERLLKKKGILENTLFLVITLEAHKEFSLMGNGFSCVLD